MLLLVHVDGQNQKVELPDPCRELALDAFKAAVCSKLVPPRADAFDWEYLDSDFDEWALLNSDAGLQGLPEKVKLRLIKKEESLLTPVTSSAPSSQVFCQYFSASYSSSSEPERRAEYFKEDLEKLGPLIAKAFDQHDMGRTGVLTEEQSQAFFESCMSAFSSVSQAGYEQAIKEVRASGDTTDEQIIKEYFSLPEIDAYFSDKANRNAAVFKILAAGGMLQKDDVIAAMMPNHDTSEQLFQTLVPGTRFARRPGRL